MTAPALTESDEATRATVAGVPGVPVGIFVGGVWRGASDGATFAVHDPATGDVLTSVADAGVADATDALDAAAAAQQAWATTTGRQRAEILRRAFDLVVARTEDIASILTAEMGKPLQESRGEVAYGAEFFRWFSEQAAHVAGSYGPAPSGNYRIVTAEQPVGPCLLITPWNFPLAMGTRKIGAALAAGCSVVIKPAALTPLTMTILVDILHEAGVPAGVVNIVTTTKSGAVSSALMADKRLRKVSFTGSTGVGSTLLRQAADNVWPGSFFAPTLIIDVPLTARIAREEIFGPVAVVYRTPSDDDAIEAANDTDFGLVGYVFSQRHGMAYAERLETGMVGVNRGPVSDPAGAFGGVKASGLGREGGASGIHEYLETKYMAVEL
jgi:succinate-semialdehyde dehydrogenase / glutarate-semialdehyde dehydrogenase